MKSRNKKLEIFPTFVLVIIVMLDNCTNGIAIEQDTIKVDSSDLKIQIIESLSLKLQEQLELFNSIELNEKLNSLRTTLNNVDVSVQSLHEKAHNWDILYHHVGSIMDQLRSFENKIDLIKAKQEEQQAYGNKLLGLEIKMNHILSKVINLSETSNMTSSFTTIEGQIIAKLNQELIESLREDRKHRDELETLLNNIAQIMQNFERLNSPRHVTISIRDDLVSSEEQHSDIQLDTIEDSLKILEAKLNVLSSTSYLREVKQLNSLTKKNAKDMEIMKSQLTKHHRNEEEQLEEMIDQWQTVSGDITTFIRSSDLFFKKIEDIVKTINRKLDSFGCQQHGNNDDENNIDSGSGNMESEPELTIDHGLIDFIQPHKSGCHDLDSPPIDGIYKFGSSDKYKEYFCAFPRVNEPGWTVIQNRGPFLEQENFNRSWHEYRIGFGDLHKDFWLGNENIYLFTHNEPHELRIELEDFDEQREYVEYSFFSVGSAAENYTLHIDGYRGDIEDGMLFHNGAQFSTYDCNNDLYSLKYNCAFDYGSGWWFKNCFKTNLNGIYRSTPANHNYRGVHWKPWHDDYSLKKARMMIRPTK